MCVKFQSIPFSRSSDIVTVAYLLIRTTYVPKCPDRMPGQLIFLLHKINDAELKLCETLHKKVVLAFCPGTLEQTFLCRVNGA